MFWVVRAFKFIFRKDKSKAVKTAVKTSGAVDETVRRTADDAKRAAGFDDKK